MRRAALLVALVTTGCGGDPESGSGTGGAGNAGTGAVAGSSGSGGTGATAGAGGAAGSGNSAGAGASGGAAGAGGGCNDTCPTPSAGVTWGCNKRFMVGTNWGWNNWGADFGGIAAWSSKGVAANSADISSKMADMQSGGVNVIRWWMFPRFLSDGLMFGADNAPSGIGGSIAADIDKALELAEQNGVFIMLTPFSFDNFYPTAAEGGINSRSMKPMLLDAALRKKLIDNLVVPIAQAVEASPHKQRMIAWDLINEPEWAVTGPNKYGGAAFDPNGSLELVTHAQMETFLQEMAAALRANSSALLSVGSTALKWWDAWLQVDQDFYQYHYYDWVYQYYPYTTHNPQSLGLTKPVVIGEFPNAGLSAVGSADKVLAELWEHGFAGGLTWAYNDSSFPWSSNTLGSFTDQHPCETKF
jgi:hypothetical protein